MTTQEKIDVLTAYRDGKKIRFRPKGTEQWHDEPAPGWDFVSNEYEVKPEPRRIWVNEYPDRLSPDYYSEERTADIAAAKNRIRAVEFVEVLESALNFIENTESEMGESLHCGELARAAIAKARGAK